MKKTNFFIFASSIAFLFLCMVVGAFAKQPVEEPLGTILIICMGGSLLAMIIAGITGIYCSDSEDYCKNLGKRAR